MARPTESSDRPRYSIDELLRMRNTAPLDQYVIDRLDEYEDKLNAYEDLGRSSFTISFFQPP